MKTILTPLTGAECDRASLDLAARVAQAFCGHINVVHIQRSVVEQVATLTMGAGAISQEIWDALAQESRSRENDARTKLDEFCSRQGFRLLAEPLGNSPSASWDSFLGDFKSTVVRLGRYCDVIVLGRNFEFFELDVDSLGEIIVRCGRPALIASSTARAQLCEVVAIAWKDSAQSAHALTAAEPYLANAKKVIVLQVPEDSSDASSAEALVRQLRWRNCNVELHTLNPLAGISRAIVTAATSLGADLLVAGAYAHSRTRELILGGVTRDLLAGCSLPLLITH